MSLKTFSAFIYGHDITDSNLSIDFSENLIDELGAEINIGSYTLTDFVNAVATALNDVGDNEYSVTVDRTTRLITISTTVPFDLYVTTGSRASTSAFSLMGFTTDRTGSNTYVGDVPTGFFYEPQYYLQRYVDFTDYVEANESSVNTSASGIVEVVSFGQNNFMECNITYCTNITGQGVIKNNPNGVAVLRAFMNYAILKKPMEFLPDIDSVNEFTACILERTRQNSKGTGFQLYELYTRGLANYFETQSLTFRKV